MLVSKFLPTFILRPAIFSLTGLREAGCFMIREAPNHNRNPVPTFDFSPRRVAKLRKLSVNQQASQRPGLVCRCKLNCCCRREGNTELGEFSSKKKQVALAHFTTHHVFDERSHESCPRRRLGCSAGFHSKRPFLRQMDK